MYALTEENHDLLPQRNHPQLETLVKDPLMYEDHQKGGSLISVYLDENTGM
jgi:hypothetical protein